MLNTAAALKTFFSGFRIPAYTLESVPETVSLPYITYPLIQPEWNEQTSYYCQAWYPKNRLADLLAKADEIAAAVGPSGYKIEVPGGWMVIYPSTPLIQILTDEHTQSAYIGLAINVYQMPGYNPPAEETPEENQAEEENQTPGENPEEGE